MDIFEAKHRISMLNESKKDTFKRVVDPLLAKVMADDILAVDVILEELQEYQIENEILIDDIKECISLTKTLENAKENKGVLSIDDIEVNYEGSYEDTINGKYDEFVIRRYIKN